MGTQQSVHGTSVACKPAWMSSYHSAVIQPPEEWQLKIPFRELAEGSVGMVVDEFGFALSEQQPNLLRYDNGNVFLDLTHHPRDGEVAIEFGRVGTDERYSFLLYMRSRAPGDDVAAHDGICWTVEDVREELGRLARALATHGRPILEAEPRAFEGMKAVRWWNAADLSGGE